MNDEVPLERKPMDCWWEPISHTAEDRISLTSALLSNLWAPSRSARICGLLALPIVICGLLALPIAICGLLALPVAICGCLPNEKARKTVERGTKLD